MKMQGSGATEAENGLNTTISSFTARKIKIETIFGDNKVETLCKLLRPVHIEIVGSDEHQVHVERIIRTVEKRIRCDFQNIPYIKCPILMVVSSLESNINWISVPQENGISKALSPSEIVQGTANIKSTHAILQLGSCVHFKIKATSTNNMKTRIMAELILGKSNKRGGHYFIYLKTGCQLNSYQWK